MTLVETIERVVGWLNLNVCQQIELKLPDDYKNDEDYNVEYVHPAAFPLYVPGKDRMPPNVSAPIPSVCVQLMEGEDDLIKGRRQLQIRFCLACWNPGVHGQELVQPKENADAIGGYMYYKAAQESAQDYTRNMDGWKDSFNLVTLVLRTLENTEFIDGLRLVKEDGIKFGVFTEDGDIWDYYPYWHSWITVKLESGVVKITPNLYEDLL